MKWRKQKGITVGRDLKPTRSEQQQHFRRLTFEAMRCILIEVTEKTTGSSKI